MTPDQTDTPSPRIVALRFNGRPVPVQSARYARNGRPYQPREVLAWKRFIHISARHQTASFRKGREPVFATGPLRVEIVYYFDLPARFPKDVRQAAENGVPVRKTTRPDVTDNLNKGLVDALTGVLWPDDSIISDCIASKRYTTSGAHTTVEVREIPSVGF